MNKDFKPTYLYIKRHTASGLRYFGKTTGTEKYLLEEYSGSGTYWKQHLAVHGEEHVVTDWYCLFTDKDDLVEFAEFFSEEADIIKSKKWANLKKENGIEGGGVKGLKRTLTTRKNISESLKGRKGKPMTEKNRLRQSESLKGKPTPMAGLSPWNKGLKEKAEVTEKRAAAQRGIKRGPPVKVICPICFKEGGINAMSRWHFDRCKNKGNEND